MESDNNIESSARDPVKDESCSVRVAVHIRPLITSELAEGCQSCIHATSIPPQVGQTVQSLPLR